MKITLLLLLFVPVLCFGQFNYQKGHVVLTNGERMEGLIKKKNWINIPKYISFKSSKDQSSSVIQAKNLKSLEVYGVVKYQRHNVMADLSSNSASKINGDRELEYSSHSLLLQVLVEGEKSLYAYKNNKAEKFFYSTQEIPVTQFEYKRYTFKKDDSGLGRDFIGENKGYIRQLKSHIACTLDTNSWMPDANKKSLVLFFTQSNDCSNKQVKVENLVIGSNGAKGKFNIVFNFGMNTSKVEGRVLGNASANNELEYEEKTHPMIGLGIRANTPNRKFSIVTDLNYNFAYTSDNQSGEIENSIDYSYLKLQFGGRYHILTGGNSSIFFGPYLFANYNLNGNISPPVAVERAIKQLVFNMAIGAGLQLGKLELDIKLSFKDSPLRQTLDASFTNFIIGGSYTIF